MEYKVSIPNGMEFYYILKYLALISKPFQFPTGWNSTKCWYRCKSLAFFRFNSQRDGILQLKRQTKATQNQCFNSQRDGILLSSFVLSSKSFLCFNSQRDGILLYQKRDIVVGGGGFNSQRDGILRNDKKITPLTRRKFQFPTGWNSTKWRAKQGETTRTFQFPTGWNSTEVPPSLQNRQRSFNSQRDGILLRSRARLSLRISFQFPTGWNSTSLNCAII